MDPFKNVPTPQKTQIHSSLQVSIRGGDLFHTEIKDEKCLFKAALGITLTSHPERLAAAEMRLPCEETTLIS